MQRPASQLTPGILAVAVILLVALPARAQLEDVIILIDSSGSMETEAALIIDQLNGIAQIVEGASVSLQVILIADDSLCVPAPLGSGMCNGLDSNQPQYLHVVESVGSNDALQTVLDTYPQWGGFLRQAASRTIIVASDDDSDLSATDFGRSLFAIDRDFGGYQFHGIVADYDANDIMDPCRPFASDQGAEYLELINKSGGTLVNLCDMNIQAGMVDVAQAIVAHAQANAPSFDDVAPEYFAFDAIELLADSGITSGCDPNNFCPENLVSRAQMAVFLERGMRGSQFAPPTATGNVFLDVGASDFAAAFIEQLSMDGITSGCGGNNFCPSASATRAQMAVFLLRSRFGANYTPPPPTGVFSDVGPGYWAAAWIEQLLAEGSTSGCGGVRFCPDDPVTRAQMAVFLANTFDLAGVGRGNVTVGNTIWRQPSETTMLSYNQVATVCDVVTGECDGFLNGINFSGWIWASVDEVGELFSTLTPHPGGIGQYFEPDSDWAPAFLELFDATAVRDGVDAWVGAKTRTEFDGDGINAYNAEVRDAAGGVVDGARTNILSAKTTVASASNGVWLFRLVPPP